MCNINLLIFYRRKLFTQRRNTMVFKANKIVFPHLLVIFELDCQYLIRNQPSLHLILIICSIISNLLYLHIEYDSHIDSLDSYLKSEVELLKKDGRKYFDIGNIGKPVQLV